MLKTKMALFMVIFIHLFFLVVVEEDVTVLKERVGEVEELLFFM